QIVDPRADAHHLRERRVRRDVPYLLAIDPHLPAVAERLDVVLAGSQHFSFLGSRCFLTQGTILLDRWYSSLAWGTRLRIRLLPTSGTSSRRTCAGSAPPAECPWPPSRRARTWPRPRWRTWNRAGAIRRSRRCGRWP